jgi:hypothetical protein
LIEDGWSVSVNTVADSMRRQGLLGREPKHRRGLRKQDRTAPKFPDLVRRDFTAAAPKTKWCGDITEISTDEGKLYLATVLDLLSRKLLACPTSTHPDAELACDAMKIATTVRGGRSVVDGVVFHSDRGSTYTARCFTVLCEQVGVRQSMDRWSATTPWRTDSAAANANHIPANMGRHWARESGAARPSTSANIETTGEIVVNVSGRPSSASIRACVALAPARRCALVRFSSATRVAASSSAQPTAVAGARPSLSSAKRCNSATKQSARTSPACPGRAASSAVGT